MDQWGLTDEHEATAARWIRTAAWGLVIKLKDPEHGIDLHPDSIEVKATIGSVVFHPTKILRAPGVAGSREVTAWFSQPQRRPDARTRHRKRHR